MRLRGALVALIACPALAQVGFYKLSAKPGAARIHGEMCVSKGPANSLNIQLFGSYCPTVGNDCADVRFDGLDFTAHLKQGVLVYRKEGCTVGVAFHKQGATVTQHGHCSDYDLLGGSYEKRAPEVFADDCTPNGSDEARHR